MSYTIRSLFTLVGLLSFASADIIGVDLSDQSKDGRKPKNYDDELMTGVDPVHRLNRFTFQKTILEEHADEVPHWIVLFCPPWFEPCQSIEPTFRELGEKWQAELNNDLLTSEVRFAAVDCATEKALCNTQNVNTYPMIVHYRHREQVKIWRGKSYDTDKQRLKDFLQKELSRVPAVNMQGASSEVTSEEGGRNIPVDFLVIFAVIAGNAWFISRGGFGSETTARATAPKLESEGSASVLRPEADGLTSRTMRSLPKEWAQERPSLEL